jgi:hypothetical protein
LTPEDFAGAVRHFRDAPLAGRNLFLWLGSESALLQTIGADEVSVLSVVDMLADVPPATSDTQVARVIRDRLEERLARISSTPAIVAFRQCEFLARYLSDFAPLFEWLTSRRLVVLLCPPVETTRLGQIPNGLVIEPGRVPTILAGIVPLEQIVEVP